VNCLVILFDFIQNRNVWIMLKIPNVNFFLEICPVFSLRRKGGQV